MTETEFKHHFTVKSDDRDKDDSGLLSESEAEQDTAVSTTSIADPERSPGLPALAAASAFAELELAGSPRARRRHTVHLW